MKNKIDKDLALAFAYDTAPDAVKLAGEAFKAAYLENIKAEQQVKLWGELEQSSKKAMVKASVDFKKELAKWDPALIANPIPEVINE